MEAETQIQLAALAELCSLLEGIEYWLMGGWAVDFHAARVTRAHTDVDFAMWLDDMPRIAELLARDGWRHVPDDDEDGGTGYERDGVRFEVTYLVRDAEGVYTPMSHGRARWSSETLGDDDVRELNGIRCRVVGLAPLTRSKAVARDDPEDGARDRADFAVLRELSP